MNDTSSKGVPTCRVLKARDTIPPSLLTPAGVPVAKTTLGRQNTVEDGGNGGLAPPAVHQSDVVGLPAPERAGSPLLGLHT